MARFKRTARDQQALVNAADRFYAALAGKEPQNQVAIAPVRKRGPVNEDMAEAGVMYEVKQLLAVHPRVMLAVRQNSGAASYEAKSGKYAPIWFYDIVRAPGPMTIVDWWGLLNDGRIWAIECKRRDWTMRPSDERAQKQSEFMRMVKVAGGLAGFARNAEDARAIIEG